MTDLQVNDGETRVVSEYLATVPVPEVTEYVVPQATGRQLAAPTVSLVIPVRNEARNIAWVLEQIADDVDEIILVDGDSTDAT